MGPSVSCGPEATSDRPMCPVPEVQGRSGKKREEGYLVTPNKHKGERASVLREKYSGVREEQEKGQIKQEIESYTEETHKMV